MTIIGNKSRPPDGNRTRDPRLAARWRRRCDRRGNHPAAETRWPPIAGQLSWLRASADPAGVLAAIVPLVVGCLVTSPCQPGLPAANIPVETICPSSPVLPTSTEHGSSHGQWPSRLVGQGHQRRAPFGERRRQRRGAPSGNDGSQSGVTALPALPDHAEKLIGVVGHSASSGTGRILKTGAWVPL